MFATDTLVSVIQAIGQVLFKRGFLGTFKGIRHVLHKNKM